MKGRLLPLVLLLLAVALVGAATYRFAAPADKKPQVLKFESFLRKPGSLDAKEKRGLYWFGPTLGNLKAQIRKEAGTVERGIVFYSVKGYPDQAVIMVRILDAPGVSDHGTDEPKWQRFERAEDEAEAIAGQKVVFTSEASMLVKIDDETLLDVVVLAPDPSLPTLATLAEQIAPVA